MPLELVSNDIYIFKFGLHVNVYYVLTNICVISLSLDIF